MRGMKIAIARSRLGFRSTSASRSKRNACWLSQPSGSGEAATHSAMPDLSEQVKAGLLWRNAVSRRVFGQEAVKLAQASKDMASRFSRGGRLIAVGVGAGVTDAQHVAVEFVHPVIVGKRALPSMDLSLGYAHWVPAMARPDD